MTVCLSGALVPRLLGQKKVKAEDATHNFVLMKDFFARYSYLVDDLQLFLEKFIKVQSDNSFFLQKYIMNEIFRHHLEL